MIPIKKWARYITEVHTFFGIEVNETEGKEVYSLLRVDKQKEELEIGLEVVCESLDGILNHINKKDPVFLVLNTSKILKKQLPAETQVKEELLVVNAFPTLEVNHFYYQILHTKGKKLVAIGKREYVDGYLEKLKKLGLNIFSFSLGIVPIGALSGFVETSVSGFDYSATFENGALSNYTSTGVQAKQAYEINGLRIGNQHLLTFSHILGYFIGTKPTSNFEELNIRLGNLFKNERVFDFGLKISLAFFLGLLLINFFLFNHYNDQNQTLQANLASNLAQDESLQQLQGEIESKEEKLRLLAVSADSKTTFYLDELGKTLPHSIWLSAMAYQPLTGPIRENKRIDKSKDHLEVSGITKDKMAFTIWTEKLETQEWVKSVEIIDYEFVSAASVKFTINISIYAN